MMIIAVYLFIVFCYLDHIAIASRAIAPTWRLAVLMGTLLLYTSIRFASFPSVNLSARLAPRLLMLH